MVALDSTTPSPAQESSQDLPQVIAAFGVGVLFAVGLGLGGMTMPHKIVDFLDIFGAWDPALLFVMVGGLAVYSIGFRLVTRRARPVLAPRFQLPTRRDINGRLLGGAALFGLGWGLAGYCPGPAIASLATGLVTVFAFVGAMAAGMLTWKVIDQRLSARADG